FHGDREAFVAKLTPDGSTYVFSTYLGGDGLFQIEHDFDNASGIAVDASGQVYISGSSLCGFPTTDNTYQEDADCLGGAGGLILEHPIVAKLSAAGDRLLYSTYLGGNGQSRANAIAVDDSGHAYVTGSGTLYIPTTRNAFSRTCHTCSDQRG